MVASLRLPFENAVSDICEILSAARPENADAVMEPTHEAVKPYKTRRKYDGCGVEA